MTKRRARTDVEEGNVPKLRGFASTAKLIAQDKENSGTIYQRFDDVSARNLLYLEAKLAVLKAKQTRFDHEDAKLGMPLLVEAANDWEIFVEYAMIEVDGPNATSTYAGKQLDEETKIQIRRLRQRMDLVKEIEKTIKTYHKALYLSSQVLSLPKPAPRTIRAFRDWFWRPDSLDANHRPELNGISETRLECENDLCALQPSEPQDKVSQFFQNHFPVLFASGKSEDGTMFTSSRRLRGFIAALAACAAYGLLIGGVQALHSEPDHSRRIGILAGFVAAFAICVSVLTDAKRAEVFAASAAYAAVLVVYVSGDNA